MRKPTALLLAGVITLGLSVAANADPDPAPVGPAVTAPVTNDLAVATPVEAPTVKPAPAAPEPAPDTGIPWVEIWAVVASILAAALAFLRFVAPRTKNTVDDGIRDMLSEILGHVRSPSQPRNPQSGHARLGMLTAIGLAVLAAGLLVTQSGCASSQRESTIKAALVTTDATREAYLAYDASRQLQIVEAATSLDDGRTKLAEHRAKRETVVAAITGVYRAIVLAATLQDSQSLDALKRALEHAVSIVNLATGAGK